MVFGRYSGRINLPADTIGLYSRRNQELQRRIAELVQVLRYRLLADVRFEPFIRQVRPDLEWILRQLYNEDQLLGGDIRGLDALVAQIQGIGYGSRPPWFAPGFLTAPAVTVGLGFAQNLFRRPARIQVVSRALFRRDNGIPLRVRLGLVGGRDDVNDLASRGIFVNKMEEPAMDADVMNSLRLTGEFPGGPGYRGSSGG